MSPDQAASGMSEHSSFTGKCAKQVQLRVGKRSTGVLNTSSK